MLLPGLISSLVSADTAICGGRCTIQMHLPSRVVIGESCRLPAAGKTHALHFQNLPVIVPTSEEAALLRITI